MRQQTPCRRDEAEALLPAYPRLEAGRKCTHPGESEHRSERWRDDALSESPLPVVAVSARLCSRGATERQPSPGTTKAR